ncbi:MAG: hypothetical protein AUK54_09850 [Helicobacteraceae bacterium CG2_30_36_10]|nr:MAG: hypothetical protein AUK54_09850 [Helicobacteraceae bacterium CG2_30_36_10]
MPRNLMKRIELLTGISDEAARDKIIQILRLQCSDNTLAHELQSDGSYIRVKKEESEKTINNHKLLEDFVNKVSKATTKENSPSASELVSRLFTESL